MMLLNHTKMAIATIRGARMRSLLTMLGIIIGVTSVLLSISIAQGIKQDTTSQLNNLGNNFITVRPGNLGNDDSGQLRQLDIGSLLSANNGISTLTEKDSDDLSLLPDVTNSAPVMMLEGSVVNDSKTIKSGLIIATGPRLPTILEKKIESGVFFGDSEIDKPFVVLGHKTAADLFGADTPLGSKLLIRGQQFTVIGVMAKEPSSTLNLGPNLDNAVYVSVGSGKKLSGGDARFQFIYLTTADKSDVNAAAASINNQLKTNHGGESDFSVIKREDAIKFSSGLSRIITTGTTMIMSLSLLVGGIGVMNIMLMLVTERTHEIGIRKALGATNRQISYQFFVEAVVLSTLGGTIGLLLSVATVTLVNAYTDISMVLTWQMIAAAFGVSVGIGVVFGVLPAIKAARKDPITALRQ